MFWTLAAVVVLVVAWFLLRVNGSIGPKRLAHEATWAPARKLNADVVSNFLADAELQLREALQVQGLELQPYQLHRVDSPKRETYVEAGILGTPLTVWIYEDGAQVSGPKVDRRFEDWDANNPSELVDSFVSAAVALAIAHRAQSNTR
jgi:hypothetical protein